MGKRILVKCQCESVFQDKEYGKQRRLATPVDKTRTLPGHKLTEVRCTVCGKVHREFSEH